MLIIPELTQEELDRFWIKVNKLGEDECWPWIAGADADGYGYFSIRRLGKQSKYRSGRIMLFLKTSDQQAVARHSCDNPVCCNPKHLDWGTYQDNADDMMSRGRHKNGKAHSMLCGSDLPQAKLTESQVLDIRKEFMSDSLTIRQLSDIYKVTYDNIRAIVKRRSWKHI